jgi:histidinol-phosphate aminotransferase
MSRFSPLPHLLAIERTSERHEQRDGYICLDRNERASPIPDDAFRAMLAQLTPHDVMAYPDAGPFIARLSSQLGVLESWIAETNGSDAALRRVFMAYLPPGGTVVTLSPSYAMYALYTKIFQGKAREIAYRADRTCDVETVLAAIGDGVNLVVLAHPDQPVGTAIAAADVRRIVSRAAQVGAICVVDEAYHPFYPVTVLPLVREFDNMFVTRSFSKYPGCAGIRLGYAVAQPGLIKGLMSVRGGNEVSALSLAIGRYMLDHPEIAEEFRVGVEQGRHILNDAARKLGFDPLPCVTNFQHLRAPRGISPVAVAEGLRRQRYLVKAGFAHPILSDCVRVSLNGPEIMQPFVAALTQTMNDIRAAGAAKV